MSPVRSAGPALPIRVNLRPPWTSDMILPQLANVQPSAKRPGWSGSRSNSSAHHARRGGDSTPSRPCRSPNLRRYWRTHPGGAPRAHPDPGWATVRNTQLMARGETDDTQDFNAATEVGGTAGPERAAEADPAPPVPVPRRASPDPVTDTRLTETEASEFNLDDEEDD